MLCGVLLGLLFGIFFFQHRAGHCFFLQEEIEKVKKRRLDREKERADQEEMLNLLQRERGIAEAVELERKEEEFHLEQAKMRAKQRIRDGRPHPIDILTANLHLAEEFDVGADEPYKAFEGLSLQQVQELHASVMSMQVGYGRQPAV